MRASVLARGLLLFLPLACGADEEANRPDLDAMGVSTPGDAGMNRADASIEVGPAGGQSVDAASAADAAGGRPGLDPSKAYLFIVHASNRFQSERIDFCLQRGVPAGQAAVGPILAKSGGPTGVGYGEMSVPREVQQGNFQNLFVVRAGATDCSSPLAYGSANGLAGASVGIVLFLQEMGVGSFGFPFIGTAMPGQDAINYRNFVHDGPTLEITAQFVPDVGAPVAFKFGQDVTPVAAPTNGRIVVASPARALPLERPYKAVAGARTSVVLLGDGRKPDAWRIVVCDHDLPDRDGIVACGDDLRR